MLFSSTEYPFIPPFSRGHGHSTTQRAGPWVCEGFISHIHYRRSPWQLFGKQKVIGRTLCPIRFPVYEWSQSALTSAVAPASVLLSGRRLVRSCSERLEIDPDWSFSGWILRGCVLAPPTSSHPPSSRVSSCSRLLCGICLKCLRCLW